MRDVSAYEAKTHLPALLREVAEGASFTITRHGVPVARLVPISDEKSMSVPEAIAALRELRKGNILGDDVTIRELIEEGRR